MSILLATRDTELTNRCRRAVSAEHHLDVADTIPGLCAGIGTSTPSVILVDAELLDPPIEHQRRLGTIQTEDRNLLDS